MRPRTRPARRLPTTPAATASVPPPAPARFCTWKRATPAPTEIRAPRLTAASSTVMTYAALLSSHRESLILVFWIGVASNGMVIVNSVNPHTHTRNTHTHARTHTAIRRRCALEWRRATAPMTPTATRTTRALRRPARPTEPAPLPLRPARAMTACSATGASALVCLCVCVCVFVGVCERTEWRRQSLQMSSSQCWQSCLITAICVRTLFQGGHLHQRLL